VVSFDPTPGRIGNRSDRDRLPPVRRRWRSVLVAGLRRFRAGAGSLPTRRTSRWPWARPAVLRPPAAPGARLKGPWPKLDPEQTPPPSRDAPGSATFTSAEGGRRGRQLEGPEAGRAVPDLRWRTTRPPELHGGALLRPCRRPTTTAKVKLGPPSDPKRPGRPRHPSCPGSSRALAAASNDKGPGHRRHQPGTQTTAVKAGPPACRLVNPPPGTEQGAPPLVRGVTSGAFLTPPGGRRRSGQSVGSSGLNRLKSPRRRQPRCRANWPETSAPGRNRRLAEAPAASVDRNRKRVVLTTVIAVAAAVLFSPPRRVTPGWTTWPGCSAAGGAGGALRRRATPPG